VYVTDSTTGGINLFNEEGHFIKKIDCTKSPWAIFIAPDDCIITDDHDNNSIIVFSPTHEMINKFGMCGNERGQFYDIYSIAINESGTIFVAEYGNRRLQIITT